jgi:hypothetical protein
MIGLSIDCYTPKMGKKLPAKKVAKGLRLSYDGNSSRESYSCAFDQERNFNLF